MISKLRLVSNELLLVGYLPLFLVSKLYQTFFKLLKFELVAQFHTDIIAFCVHVNLLMYTQHYSTSLFSS